MFAKIDNCNDTSLIVGGDFNRVIGPSGSDYQGSRPQHSNMKSSEMLSVLIEGYHGYAQSM